MTFIPVVFWNTLYLVTDRFAATFPKGTSEQVKMQHCWQTLSFLGGNSNHNFTAHGCKCISNKEEIVDTNQQPKILEIKSNDKTHFLNQCKMV